MSEKVVRFPTKGPAPLQPGGNDLPGATELPQWVIDAGYRVIAYRVPVAGEMFFSTFRGEQILVAKDDSGGPRLILEYVGGPR